MAPTQGFTLSALPRAPRVPENIGVLDMKAIDEGVRRGLETFEMVRRAPRSMILADATADNAAAQQNAERASIPARSSILSDQASVSTARAPLAVAQAGNEQEALKRQQAAQAQAAQQFADFTDAYANAQGLADYSLKAQELEALPVKFPWLTQVQEYKSLLTRIADSTTAARQAATQQTSQEGAIELAKTKSAGTKTPDQRLLEDLIRLKQEQQANPDDPYLPERIEQTQQLLNKKQSNSVSDPSAQRDLQREIAQMRNVPAEQRVKMEFEKRAQAARNLTIDAEVNSESVNDLVKTALEKVGPMSVGFGGTMLSKIGGTEGADLRNIRDTIRSVVTLQTLSNLRSLSATGGALGNVSDADLKLLGTAIASLEQDQSVDQFKSNLAIIQKRMSEISDRRKAAYAEQFGPEAYARIFGSSAPVGLTPSVNPQIPSPASQRIGEFEIIEVR